MTKLEILGRRLGAARERCALTLLDAATAGSIDPDKLVLYEAGKADPYLDEVRALALLYGVTIDYLAGLDRPTNRLTDESNAGVPTVGRCAPDQADRSEGAGAFRKGVMTDSRDHQGLERLSAEGSDERTASPTGDLVHGKDTEPPQPRFLLKAAVIVASAALLVGGISIGRVMLWPSKLHSTRTLQYRDAILILMDTRETDKRREGSAIRIFRGIVRGVRALRHVHEESGELGQASREVLDQLRDVLHGKSVFIPSKHRQSTLDLDESLRELAVQLQDYNLPLVDRLNRQRILADGVVLGILALKGADADPELPRDLRANLRGYLRNVERTLPN